jgi:hypothetical protein
MRLNNFNQLILDPTREENILDLLFIDTPNLILDSGVLPSLHNLDHEAIFGVLKLIYAKSRPFLRHVWYYDRGNYDLLNEILYNAPWHDIINDSDEIDHIVAVLTNTILTASKETIPNRTVKIRPKDKPWFSAKLRKLFRERDRCHKRQKRTKNPLHVELFKAKRTETNRAYKEAKRNYFTNISQKLLDNNFSPKNYWKLIKNTMGEFNDSSIPNLIENDLVITDNKHKAQIINDFFIAQTKLPPITKPLPPFVYKTDARLCHIDITPNMYQKIPPKVNCLLLTNKKPSTQTHLAPYTASSIKHNKLQPMKQGQPQTHADKTTIKLKFLFPKNNQRLEQTTI